MDRNTVSWRGYIPAITTPFDDKSALDLGSFRIQMEWLRNKRMDGVILAGTSGEWFSMSQSERAKLFSVGSEFIDDEFVVIGGCNAFTAREVIAYAQIAMKEGLNGILVTPPPYIVPSGEEIVSFYQQISNESEIPIIVYNWPRGCIVDMGPELLEEISRIENVVAIKNSTSDFASFLDGMYKLENSVRYFGLPTSEIGVDLALAGHGDGLMGSGGALGADHSEFWRAIDQGNRERAVELGKRDTVLMQAWFYPDYGPRFGNQQAIMKTALRLQGVPAGCVRAPLRDLSKDEVSFVSNTLNRLGIETESI